MSKLMKSGFANWRNLIPLLSSWFFLVMMTILAFIKLHDEVGAAFWVSTGVIVLYYAWVFAESKIAISEVSKGDTECDGGSCEWYATARGFTVYTALGFSNILPFSWPLAMVAVSLFVVGVMFRLTAIRSLGRFYSHRVRVDTEHQVIDTGPYRWVRHPAYTGMLIAHLGFLLLFFNWVALAVFCCFLVPTIVHRIRIEEKALMRLVPYQQFAINRARLMPKVW